MEFRDLKKQYEVLKPEIDAAIAGVIEGAHFVGGPEVRILEERLAEYVGTRHCITCANGTDALTLALMAWGIGPGDAVFVPDFTFFASGESPAFFGATPIYVDVDEDTYNIDPIQLEKEIVRVKSEGRYTPKVVVAVDLFGQPADYQRIRPVCERYGLWLLEDGAQGFGGFIDGRRACSFGDISTTSFFPAKPLGCYGDGGAIFTDKDEWACLLRSLAVHGKDRDDKYNNVRIGMNSRLDSIQAAILQVKLKAFCEYELESVDKVARYYMDRLEGSKVILPAIVSGFQSSWAQYTIRLPEGVDRATFQNQMKGHGIPTMVYYKKPMHMQEAFRNTDSTMADCPVTEQLCSTVLSLPIGPYMTECEVGYIAESVEKLCM